jgi:hypothetical protein
LRLAFRVKLELDFGARQLRVPFFELALQILQRMLSFLQLRLKAKFFALQLVLSDVLQVECLLSLGELGLIQ